MSDLHVPEGFRAAGIKAGIKESGSPDLAVIVSDWNCSAAGTFTTNKVAAAPVQWDRAIVPTDRVRAIVVNAGNANAATGAEGLANVRRTAEIAAHAANCHPDQVLVASTGVIGRQLPMEKIEAGVPAAVAAIDGGPEGFHAFSRAIMTTDTKPKVVSRRFVLEDGREVRVLGIAKGAAMIGPNMATMLAFLVTDAIVTPGILQGILADAVDHSFNCISVEGDTSTNDSVLMLAHARGDHDPLAGADLRAFASVVRESCEELAKLIPADGEGATHFITVEVAGCRDRDEAHRLARTVADSPLVKTAIHGADPNWGRLLMAAGRSGVPFEEADLVVELCGVPLFRDGAPVPFDADALSQHLRTNRDVTIRLTLRNGDASLRFWTCDLTAEYVRLNADYTT